VHAISASTPRRPASCRQILMDSAAMSAALRWGVMIGAVLNALIFASRLVRKLADEFPPTKFFSWWYLFVVPLIVTMAALSFHEALRKSVRARWTLSLGVVVLLNVVLQVTFLIMGEAPSVAEYVVVSVINSIVSACCFMFYRNGRMQQVKEVDAANAVGIGVPADP